MPHASVSWPAMRGDGPLSGVPAPPAALAAGLRRRLACVAALASCALAGCAGLGALPAGLSETEVRARWGEPAERQTDAAGRVDWVYPRGPNGFRTDVVEFDAAGRVRAVRNALEPEQLAAVQPGMSEAEVLRRLGPSEARWSAYFAARDEWVREWRVCDVWSSAARFGVLFDGTRRTVRATYNRPESDTMRARVTCGR